MLATIMQAIDTTIANVALPHIQGSLSAAQDQITWILTSYTDLRKFLDMSVRSI
jgi:MFS transporter, DHA2 family, multidrug resistance protein